MGRKLGPGPVAVVLATRTGQRLLDWKSKRISVLLRRSGRTGNPAVIAKATAGRAVTAAFIAVPAAFVGVVFLSPLALLGLAAPLVVLVAPEVLLRDAAVQRKEGVEKELPFFSIFASVLAGAGVSLFSALESAADGEVFPSMRAESMLMQRDVSIFGMNPNDAMERLASGHPSSKFSNFLLGYTSKVRSGGDVSAYLSHEGGGMLRTLEGEWARYVARVGIIGSMMITVFGVVPLLLMVVGVFSPGYSATGLFVFTGVGVPLVTVGLLHMAGSMQPTHEERLTGKAAGALALAAPGALLGYFFGEPWVGVAAGLSVFFLAYGLTVRGQLLERRAVDEGLALFLKDLLEYKRQEYDLTKSVISIQGGSRYNPRFDRLLAKVAAQLRSGVPLDAIEVRTGSSIGRLAFLLLGEMSRSGGGTVDTVYQASSFVDRMSEMKRDAGAEMKPYVILSYLAPPLLAFGVAFVGGVLSSLGSRVAQGLNGLHQGGAQAAGLAGGLAQVSDVLIVVSAASLGLIAAKMTDMTARNTLKASANVLAAGAAVAVMGGVGSHSLMQLLWH